MLRSLVSALVGLAFLGMAGTANADIIQANDPAFAPGLDGFNLTQDTAAGLEWLDLTLSTNRTFSDVSSQFGTGGDFEGFRYATVAEIVTFWSNAGIPDIGSTIANFSPAQNLISLLGCTGNCAQFNIFTGGFNADIFSPGDQSFSFIQLTTDIFGNPRGNAAPNTSSIANISVQGGLSEFGSWLVRDITPIPELATLDIKPGSDPNSINPRSKGVIPVAILTTDTFDATTVDPSTVRFGPSDAGIGHRSVHFEDVDDDGDLDLLLHFRTQQTGIACGDTEASLSGTTFDGSAIEGSDSVVTVGCK